MVESKNHLKQIHAIYPETNDKYPKSIPLKFYFPAKMVQFIPTLLLSIILVV